MNVNLFKRNKKINGKSILKIFLLFLSFVLTLGIGGVAALTLYADDIIYNPSNSDFKVSDAQQALDELYAMSSNGSSGTIYKLGSCTSTATFSIANIVGKENVGNYSSNDFLVVSGGVSTSLEADADSSHIGHDATASFGLSAPSVSYNNTTGVVTVGGGSWSMSIYMKYSDQPATSGAVTKTVYFIEDNEIVTPQVYEDLIK